MSNIKNKTNKMPVWPVIAIALVVFSLAGIAAYIQHDAVTEAYEKGYKTGYEVKQNEIHSDSALGDKHG